MHEYLDQLDPHTVAFYLQIPPAKVVLFQGLFELYEGVGTVRTLNLERAIIVVLTTPDLVQTVFDILANVRDYLPSELLPRPKEAEEHLIDGVFSKKARESSSL